MTMGWFFRRQKPRKPTGGIKAQNKRGQFGATWWGKRWVEVLESFDLGARLQRGRSYARGGQVLNIDIEPGQVTSKVQGSRSAPYRITIQLPVLTDAQWKKIETALNASAIHAAKLLAGEMPTEVEELFLQQGAPLFPQEEHDLTTSCSCPDYANPCKHIAAVYLLLAEEFDRDPFLLFRLRGRSREQILGALTPEPVPEEAAVLALPPEPLPEDAALFWAQALLGDLFGEVVPPRDPAAWLRRLGNFPFWRGEQPLVQTLEALYDQGSRQGVATFLGSTEEEPPPLTEKPPRKKKK
jgi:uncharacterized Zn finger protein